MSLNLNALHYFEVVARYEHFTKAANELYISQSTLSKAIESLEREIGVQLFEKKGRNVTLTIYGKILRDYVQNSMRNIEEGVRFVQSSANKNSGRVRLSAIYSVGSFLLPQYIKRFSEENEQIKVRYFQKPTYEILEDLLDGETDIGICSNYEETEAYASLNRELITTEELWLIVPEDHPLAEREMVDFDELLEETWIGYNGNTGMARAILDIMKSAGVRRKIHFSYYASEDSSIVGLVRAGLGIGMIPKNPYLSMEGVRMLRIRKPFFYRNIYMVWNKDIPLSPATKKFRKHILKES